MEDQAYYELQDTNMDIPSTRNPYYNVAQPQEDSYPRQSQISCNPFEASQAWRRGAQKATTYYNRPGTESEMPVMQDNPSYTTCLESTALESRTASTVENNYDNCTMTVLPSYDNTKTATATATRKLFYDNPELRTKPATSGTSKPFYDDPELPATVDKPPYKTASSVKTSSLESDIEIQVKKPTSNCRCYSWVIMLFVTVTIALSCTSMCICIWNVYRIRKLMNQEPLIIAAAIENDTTTTTTTPIPILECGSESWTPVIRLDMSNSSQQCPDGWMEYDSPRRSCGRQTARSLGATKSRFPSTPRTAECAGGPLQVQSQFRTPLQHLDRETRRIT